MSAKHTPGPWHMRWHQSGNLAGKSGFIVERKNASGFFGRDVVSDDGFHPVIFETEEMARAAIAKAEGKQ